MDKYTPPVSIPTTSTQTIKPSYSPPAQTNNWQPVHQQSFEQALRRADSGSSGVKADRGPHLDSSTQADEASDEASQGEDSTTEQLTARPEALSALSTADSKRRQLLDDTEIGIGESAAFAGDAEVTANVGASVGADTAGASPAAPSATLSGPFSAQSVAELMARMERMPGSQSGIWNIGVLNHAAGVTAMQLQRSLQGGWRVSVSMSTDLMTDGVLQADELKAALIAQGHDVDAVLIQNKSTADDA